MSEEEKNPDDYVELEDHSHLFPPEFRRPEFLDGFPFHKRPDPEYVDAFEAEDTLFDYSDEDAISIDQMMFEYDEYLLRGDEESLKKAAERLEIIRRVHPKYETEGYVREERQVFYNTDGTTL